jgi:hypothetical protein
MPAPGYDLKRDGPGCEVGTRRGRTKARLGFAMADEEDSIVGVTRGSPTYAILAELAILVRGLVSDRLEAGQKITELEAGRLDNPLDVKAKRTAIRRDAARAHLVRMIRFLNSQALADCAPKVLEHGADNHLRDLLGSLDDVAAGARATLFEPSSTGQRVASPTDEEFRARVAVAAELLIRGGDERDDACSEVAQQLNEFGYRMPRGRKGEKADEPITGTTVRNWLKRAREAGRSEEIGIAFQQYLEIAERWVADGTAPSLAAAAQRILAGLAQELQGGPAFFTPLKPQ